jgi:hypothetical protein
MPDTPQILADRLILEGGRVVDFFKHLRPDQWAILVYPKQSEWNYHTLLSHFVSAEIGRRELISDVCNGGEGAPTNFDIDFFNRTEVLQFLNVPNDVLIRRFASEREKLSQLVNTLSSEDLTRMGNDPFLGRVSVSEMIKLTYRHLQIHLREVRQVVE